MKKVLCALAFVAGTVALVSCGESEAEQKVKEEAAKVEQQAKETVQKLDEGKKALMDAESDLDAALEDL